LTKQDTYLTAHLEPVEEIATAFSTQEIEIMMRSLMSQFEQYIKLNKKIPPEILVPLLELKNRVD
jgi:ATP-dependent Lon protease